MNVFVLNSPLHYRNNTVLPHRGPRKKVIINKYNRYVFIVIW